MKKLFLLFLLTSGFAGYSQNFITPKAVSVTAEVIETQAEDYKVRSKEMNFDEKKKIVEYTGNVVFITDMITLEADNIVYNHSTREVVATGNFRTKNITIEYRTSSKPTVLRYRIGDAVAYLE